MIRSGPRNMACNLPNPAFIIVCSQCESEVCSHYKEDIQYPNQYYNVFMGPPRIVIRIIDGKKFKRATVDGNGIVDYEDEI